MWRGVYHDTLLWNHIPTALSRLMPGKFWSTPFMKVKKGDVTLTAARINPYLSERRSHKPVQTRMCLCCRICFPFTAVTCCLNNRKEQSYFLECYQEHFHIFTKLLAVFKVCACQYYKKWNVSVVRLYLSFHCFSLEFNDKFHPKLKASNRLRSKECSENEVETSRTFLLCGKLPGDSM